MEIEYPENFDTSAYKNKFLCRYLDLYKLLDILNNHQLYFTRLDKFDDPLEGITVNAIKLKLFNSATPITEENINKAFTEEEQKDILARDKFHRSQYEIEISQSQKSQFANCWFKGEKESIAMWRLYSKEDGVILKFDSHDLIEAVVGSAKQLKELEHTKMTFGDLEYKNIWPFDWEETFSNKFNALKKDNSYSHENEFRFIIAVPGDMIDKFDHIVIPITSLTNLNFEILASPFMQNWKLKNLAKLLSKYELEGKLKQSKTAVK